MFQSDEEEESSGDERDMWNSSQDSEFESYLGRIEDYTKRRVPNALTSNLIAVSSGGVKDFKVPNCLNPEELQCSFEKGWNELLPEAERTKLQKLHGIEEDSLKAIDASEVIKGNICALPQSQQAIIQSLIKQGFFSKIYQKKLAIEKMLSLYDQKDQLEKQLREVQLQLQLQQQGSEQSEADTPATNASQNEQNEEGDKLLNALMFESEISSSQSQSARQSSQELIESQLASFNEFRGSQDSDRTLSYISDMETDNPKSEYNKQRRRDIKELSKQFARDAIKRHNKKQLQAFTFTTESRLPGRTRISISDVIDEDFDLAWIQSSERFKSCARARQTLTIAAFNPKDPFVIEYRRQESERYRNPLDPWLYYLPDGRTAIVGPVYRKKAQIQNKPREHLFLKSERPASANILAIVRDAASRLPDFIGTRSDVSELCKASQFLSDNLTDFYISQTVSGGLDRLSAEEDPCVRYDQTNKLWIYLHGKRKLDSHKWLSGLNCQETARKQAGERGGFSSNEIYGIGKSTPSSSGTSSAMKRQGINSTNDTTDPNRISDNE